MSGFEWFLLVVVVILVPLVVAVAITLWTLEQARQRNRKNREGSSSGATPVKRRATRDAGADASMVTASTGADSKQDEASDDAGAASPDGVKSTPTVREPMKSGNDDSGSDDGPSLVTPMTPRADAKVESTNAGQGTTTDGQATVSGPASDDDRSTGDGGRDS